MIKADFFLMEILLLLRNHYATFNFYNIQLPFGKVIQSLLIPLNDSFITIDDSYWQNVAIKLQQNLNFVLLFGE